MGVEDKGSAYAREEGNQQDLLPCSRCSFNYLFLGDGHFCHRFILQH